ncbi:hypothetical protein ACFOUR_07040 [Halovivax cerinus]|uniref:Transposase n=1 Tax=Halovivax cerinus TaxID=1487865 RepID=A0ABD5NMN2_9EURY
MLRNTPARYKSLARLQYRQRTLCPDFVWDSKAGLDVLVRRLGSLKVN